MQEKVFDNNFSNIFPQQIKNIYLFYCITACCSKASENYEKRVQLDVTLLLQLLQINSLL